MKYHQFSEAIRSLKHITGKHELVVVVSGTPYIVDNISLNDMKQVVIHAYSIEYINNNRDSLKVIPIQCDTLVEFQRQYVDTPQSFIPLGSTFNKELPDLIIYLDDKGFVNPEYKIKSMCVDNHTIKYAPVLICDESSPFMAGTLQIDGTLKQLEKEFDAIEAKNKEDDNFKYRIEVIRYELSSTPDYMNNYMNHLGTYAQPDKSKGFNISDYHHSSFNSGYSSLGTSLSMAYFSTKSEVYYVEKWNTVNGILELHFADGKIKCIPMNTIKEFNVEEKNGGEI